MFENVRVPRENLLGELNKGFTLALATLDGGRIGIAAQALGIAQAASRPRSSTRASASSSTGHRRVPGDPGMLANIGDRGRPARLLDLPGRVAARPRPPARKEARWRSGRLGGGHPRADEAVQIHGGAGYPTEFPVERLFRDARITEIYEGTTEIQKIVIAGQVLKEHARER